MLIDKIKYKNSLCDLWHTVFGDSYDYIKLIFRSGYENDILCFGELDGEIAVSALYLIKNTLKFNNKLYNGWYLYAAATLPEYRAKGIMSRLIKEAQLFCKENGDDYISLVPSQESLYSYYSRFGFADAMYRYKGIYKSSESNGTEIFADEIGEAEKIRQSFDGNMLFTIGKAFSYCKDCLDAAGISFISLTEESGILISEEEKLVLEYISSQNVLSKSEELLKNKLPCGEWEINSPFELPFCEDN